VGLSPVTLNLPALMVSAFLVSLATVAVPGPITLVASRLAMDRRTSHAAWFLAGVTLLDVALFAALAGGAAPVLARVGAMPVVELAGGTALVVAAVAALRRHRVSAAPSLPSALETRSATRSFVLGVAVAAGNPQYWVWWVTAGLAFVEAARNHGPLGLALMLAALVGGVVSWYVPLLWALHRGRTLISARGQLLVVRLLGALLLLLGCGLIALGALRLSR
jgi:threonine/homoserine/homoserine lactone efflux protein